MRKLYPIEEVANLIKSGKSLALAGDERALSQLPKGNWIGGTIPYFMNDVKGEFSQTQVFVNEISSFSSSSKISAYDKHSIANITEDRYENGYTLLLIPAFQEVHSTYALKAPDYPDLFTVPIIGWVTGFNLDSDDKPKTINGLTGEVLEDQALAFHVELPDEYFAQAEIVNIHEEWPASDQFEFLEDGFRVNKCLINGEQTDFATYLKKNSIDGTAPLISDFGGAKINVSIKEINTSDNFVDLYAPVFKGRTYQLAKAIPDYAEAFGQSVPTLTSPEEFSCNCILNYLYGELESKNVGMTGPATFGEIAYVLLNQTLVYMTIGKKE
jgi:hypothetical protein